MHKRHVSVGVRGLGWLLVGVLLAGCATDFYPLKSARLPMASQDRYEFESTMYRPVTISLAETFDANPLWTMDVPVDHVLVVDLDRFDEIELVRVSGRPARRMTWYLYGPDRGLPTDQGVLELQGVPVMLKVDLRTMPEYPVDYRAQAR